MESMERLKVTVWTWGKKFKDPNETFVSAWVTEKGVEEIIEGDKDRFQRFVIERGCFNPDGFDEVKKKWIPGVPQQLVFEDDPIKFCLNVPAMYSNTTYFWMTVEDENGKSALTPNETIEEAAERTRLFLHPPKTKSGPTNPPIIDVDTNIEAWALARSPTFLDDIDRTEAEIAAGTTTSLDDALSELHTHTL